MTGYSFGRFRTQIGRLAGEIAASLREQPDELVAAREDLIETAKELRVMADDLEQRALNRWDEVETGMDWQLVVDGVGVFHRGRKNAKYEWQHRDLGLAVADAALARGLVHHPRDVFLTFNTVAAVDYWRVRALSKDLGIDGHEYRTVIDPGKPCLTRDA